MKYLIFIACVLFLSSCTKEELDFTGFFEVISLRDECPDSNDNAQVNASEDGICLQATNGVECIQIDLNIAADGTFTMQERIGAQAFGSFVPLTVNDFEGSYTTTDNMITLNRASASTLTMMLDDTERLLDWNVSSTSTGCERYFQFRKQM